MESPETPYQVEYAGQSLRQLEYLVKQAVHLGTFEDLALAVRTIQQRLRTAPL